MRLYLLDHTPLGAAMRFARPPRPGDVVVFTRFALDPEDAGADALRQQGVEVLWAEEMMDADARRNIARLGADFINQWYLDDGEDISRLSDMSIGKALTRELARLTNPRLMIYNAEIIRCLLERYRDAEEIITDIRDGRGVSTLDPRFQPFRKLAGAVAARLGRKISFAGSVDTIPSRFTIGCSPVMTKKMILRSLLGGFRPKWLAARLRWHFRSHPAADMPVLYVFASRSTRSVISELTKQGKLRMAISELGFPRTHALRYDHLLTLPALADIRTALRLRKHLRQLAEDNGPETTWSYNGFDYGPFLAVSLAAALKSLILPYLFVVAQVRKLQRISGLSAALINAEGASAMGILIAINETTDRKIYSLPHGVNVFRMTVPDDSYDNSHVTYLACGGDHQGEFGVHMPEAEKPPTPVVGNPAIALMNPIRGSRSASHQKRLLVFSFGNMNYRCAERERAIDTYLIDVFSVIRELVKSGWTVSYRGHPNHPLDLEKRLAGEMGLSDAIKWDDHPTLESALLAHDVVVSNITTGYYQALYAGWPTIFYEPDYLRTGDPDAVLSNELFVGVPVARDIERPVTCDRETLLRLIHETLDPDSKTSTFPNRFADRYAERFIGPNPETAHLAVAGYLEKNLLSQPY